MPFDIVTFFGDFDDGFGGVPIAYESGIPYSPGMLVPIFHEAVLSLPKFDPSLGTLTDITVFVDAGSPIFYTLGGTMEVTEVDGSLAEFGAMVGLEGDVSLNYMGSSLSDIIAAESIGLGGADVGTMGMGSFSTPVAMAADGSLTGTKSIFGSVDLADFVGTGMVDSLFVDLVIEDTADFTTANSTATAALSFDVFDSDSGADDPVIGITYTYSVPEPSSAVSWILGAIICSIGRGKRRRNGTAR